MASFFSSVRQGFSRPSNRNGNQRGNGAQTPSASPISANSASAQSLPHSPSLSSNVSVDSPNANAHDGQVAVNTKPPFFFREEHAGFVVKGNFMTLAAKPQHVELGEWLAHHMVELYRILVCQLQCIQELDGNTGNPICNPRTCPTMSAATHTYTWLDQNKAPVKIPAYQYISLVQKWISGKLLDPNTLPTDPNTVSSATPSAATYASGGLNTPGSNTPIPAGPTSLNLPLSALAGHDWIGKASNFPEHFYTDCKNIARQMFRCYAHLYWGHWLDPFYHIGRTKDLNSCFVHFLNVSLLFGLLTEKDTEPMQPLIDIWIANKSISTENLTNFQQRQATPSPSANGS
ncbi:Mob1/phocein [Xylona heveae TC161]|uniref:Mob1/phocein n=1 Tax=Xylona heveae (strain CBS 132557 / TC161) TaxID=1328760 RepID=A0A165JND9_XYLHT|nr:Mob1/phocein [Xylona heveae TC161]KZF26450.1 Mob1/phocein [Xylona heveae TC161]